MNMIKALLLGAAAAASLAGPACADVIFTPGGAPDEPTGQHSVTATPDGEVTIALPGNSPFHHLFFDIGVRADGAGEGNAVLTVSLVGGHELSRTVHVSAGTRNFLTIAATEDDAIAALRIASALEIEAVDVLRIGAVAGEGSPAPVPEPATIGLLGLGLAAIGWRSRCISVSRNQHRIG